MRLLSFVVVTLLACGLASGCVASGMAGQRDYTSTPRREAGWVMLAGAGEIALGGAIAVGVSESIADPPPREPDAGPSDGGEVIDTFFAEVGTAIAFLGLAGVLVTCGVGDLALGGYQLAVGHFVLGDIPDYN
jgi:hypothetical protein